MRAVQRKAGSFKRGASAVGSYLPQLTRKVFEKYGFSTADLLTDWPAIAGAELAAFTVPQQLKWPRKLGESENGVASERRGATLVLRVDGGRALDVQYQSRQIIERINGYFGYRAVSELRLVQAPIEAAKPVRKTPSPKDVIGSHKPELPEMKDEGLRAALERLGANVLAEKAARQSRG
ncbi:MAG: hypothetical protein RLZ98_517 [Pseudomonadota bacterium]|jgi:hypothetical protein